MNPNLIALATRVLERALQKSGHLPPHVYEAGDEPPADDGLVDALAGQLIGFISRLDAAYVAAQQAGPASGVLAQDRARIERLARALGACECWGEALTCSRCGGRGAPGWRLPERAPFEALVRPALKKVSRFQLAARNGRFHSP
jgi:hypothetical protein